jgi:hypothetical protein
MTALQYIDTLQCGPRHAGHSRAIYAGNGCELWHEVHLPWNIFAGMTQKAFLYVPALPAIAPAGATFCGMQERYYSPGEVAVIIWEGADCLEAANRFALTHVKRDN